MLTAASLKILEEGAAKLGLVDKLPILVRHAREAILIETKIAHSPLQPGQSRIAGRPDLPPNLAWPKDSDNVDLQFVAQINLAELPSCGIKDLLPPTGHLYFFCNDCAEGRVFYEPSGNLQSAEQTFGPPPITGGFWKKLFTPKPKGLRLCEINFRVVFSLPQPAHVEYASLEKDMGGVAMKKSLFDLNEFVATSDSAKLFGFADHFQGNDLRFDAQCSFDKIPSNDIYENPGLEPQRQAAADWLLLLQLPSDDDANMMWGDAGNYYFMIRRQDLAVARFDNFLLMSESH